MATIYARNKITNQFEKIGTTGNATDTTLTLQGSPADAKATGDKIKDIQIQIETALEGMPKLNYNELENRPVYSNGMKTVVILPETVVETEINEDDGSSYGTIPYGFELEVGKSYTVTYNGVEYVCVAQWDEDYSRAYIWHRYQDGGGGYGGFGIMPTPTATLVMGDGGTYSITTEVEDVKKLDPKFLPDMTLRLTIIDDTTAVADKTKAEVIEALRLGIPVIVRLDGAGDMVYVPIGAATLDGYNLEFVLDVGIDQALFEWTDEGLSYTILEAESAFSPVATVTETADGAVITIEDAEGTTTATIKHGKDGQDGKDGADGDTGPAGPQGPAGSDANVTADNIESALGYTPADAADLEQLSNEKVALSDRVTALENNELLYADSIEECTDTSKRYVLPDGYIYEYVYSEQVITNHTNRILSSIDSDGTPFNGGLGYKTGYRFDSSGTEASPKNGHDSVVSGFIPYNGENLELRIPTSTAYGDLNNYLHVYNSNFTCLKKDTNGTTIDGSYRRLDQWEELYGASYVTEGSTLKFSFPAESLAIDGIAYVRVSSAVTTTLDSTTFDLALGESLSDSGETVSGYMWTNTGLYYGSENRIVALENTANDHETRLTTLETSSGNNIATDDVPEYWKTELETKATAIQTAMEKAGRKKSAFLWYTDAHWVNGNSKMSPKILNYLYENTPMNKVNFGGDIIGDTLLATRDEMEYLYEWRKAIKSLPNHHSVFGNHDNFNLDTVDYENENYRYAFLLAPEETNDMVMGDGNYYYIDNHAEKTRYLYLDYITSNQAAMMTQGQFMVDAINGVLEGWHIVAIAHRWWQYNSSSTPLTGAIPNFEADMLSVFDAYNARATRSGSNYFSAQDFTNAKGKVEFCIGGHIHVDYDFRSDGGIPIIITAPDTNQDRVPDSTVDSGVVGTTTEVAVFGIIADYNDTDNTKITIVGVGRGTSRTIGSNAVPTALYNVSYTGELTEGNVIDKSKLTFTVEYSDGSTKMITGASSVQPETFIIDEDSDNTVTVTVNYIEGAVTVSGIYVNTVNKAESDAPEVTVTNLADPTSADWLTDSRFSTSSISSATGGIITNYIPCTHGDTVRVKGLKINTVLGGSSTRVRMYNGTTVIDGGNVSAQGMIDSANGSGVNGDVTTLVFVAGNNTLLTTYITKDYDRIRLNGTLIDGYTANDVVITVGEEIPA